MIHNAIETAVHYDTDPVVKSQADTAAASRRRFIDAVASLAPYLPELPDQQAFSTYERLVRLERSSVAKNDSVDDYADGTAESDDEILTIHRDGSLLLSADHATNPIRKSTGVLGRADHGTAALALSLGEDLYASVVLPRGKQTGNANVDVDHPMKDQITTLLPGKTSFLSVHGMMPGKFSHQFDPTEIHGVIGLGANPSEMMLDTASTIRRLINDIYGLRIEIGGENKFFDDPEGDGKLRYDDDGKLIYSHPLAALGPGTTTNFVRALRSDIDFPAMQIEISRSLRLLPKEMEYREERHKVMAVYLGYLTARDITIALDNVRA